MSAAPRTELGGAIKAKSEGGGKGARFTLTLPVEASGGLSTPGGRR